MTVNFPSNTIWLRHCIQSSLPSNIAAFALTTDHIECTTSSAVYLVHLHHLLPHLQAAFWRSKLSARSCYKANDVQRVPLMSSARRRCRRQFAATPARCRMRHEALVSPVLASGTLEYRNRTTTGTYGRAFAGNERAEIPLKPPNGLRYLLYRIVARINAIEMYIYVASCRHAYERRYG